MSGSHLTWSNNSFIYENSMKTILFFDRCDLTTLYILLTKELQDEYNIIHVAFSYKEEKQLKEAGIFDYISLEKERNSIFDTQQTDEIILNEMDDFIIQESNGIFNLNSSIQADRCFTVLSYEEALHLAQSYYITWKNIFLRHHVDIMFHEACSLLMVHVAALICKAQGGEFYYLQQCASDEGYTYLFLDGEDYTCPELEQRYSYYKDHREEIDMKRVQAYIDTFRRDETAFMGNLLHKTEPKYKIRINSLYYELRRIIRGNRFDRVRNNVDYWLSCANNTHSERLNNLNQYKKRGVRFEEKVPKAENYYFYPIHLEPESTVTYLGEGIYKNQIKLIENIAGMLPPGTFLYVKDHPHEYAYRNADDYERLMKVPNIRLLHQSISGKAIIKNAKGVFTINGTGGFEAVMMGKQVYCFARNYYSFFDKVNYIKNIKDTREIVYSNINKEYKDDEDLYAFVYAYLKSAHPGFVAYFNLAAESEIDATANAKMVADEIRKLPEHVMVK